MYSIISLSPVHGDGQHVMVPIAWHGPEEHRYLGILGTPWRAYSSPVHGMPVSSLHPVRLAYLVPGDGTTPVCMQHVMGTRRGVLLHASVHCYHGLLQKAS